MSTVQEFKNLLQQRRFNDLKLTCEMALARPNIDETEYKHALQYLGTAHYFEGQISQSMDCFKKILEKDPKHTDAAIALSVMYNDIGKYDEARKIYQVANQALQLKKPGNDMFLDRKFSLKHLEIGDLYFKYHRYDDALDDYVKAFRLDQNNLDLRIKIAKVYAKKGFTTRALQELKQLCHEHPDFLEGRAQLGLMYFSLGNVIEAEIEWKRILEDEPNHKEVRSYLDMASQATETKI